MGYPLHETSLVWGYIFESMRNLQIEVAYIKSRQELPDTAAKLDTIPWNPAWLHFRSMVEVYSKPKITQETDKLLAIAALANRVAPIIQSEYVAEL